MSHVPIGASEYNPMKYHHLHPQFNSQFLRILQNYSDIIDAGFFAHQHTDAFKIVYSTKGENDFFWKNDVGFFQYNTIFH